MSVRVPEHLKERLDASASAAGHSLTAEIEFRLNRDLSWEETKQSIERLRAEAAAELEETRLRALRLAGFQIVAEMGGPQRVTIDIDRLRAAAKGVMASGFLHTDEADQWIAGTDRHDLPKTMAAEPAVPTSADDIRRAVVEALREVLRPDLLA